MDLQNKVYFIIQLLFILLFIPFILLSMLISLIKTTINNFFHQENEEEIKKDT